jgi:AraC-like DNA-binding protein
VVEHRSLQARPVRADATSTLRASPFRRLGKIAIFAVMPTLADENASSAMRKRTIAAGDGWSVGEFVCDAGPGDRPFEERHESFAIAATLAGSFTYRGETGEAALFPGALLLGNAGQRYACGHAHSRGDRCVSLALAPEAFAEIAASSAGSSRYRFAVDAAPPHAALTPLVAGLEGLARETSPLRIEERALEAAARIVAIVAGRALAPPRASARELERIAEAARAIESSHDETLDLAALARVARLSKFHFLRVFRRAVGATPHQYLIATRLRRAAARLSETSESVTAIAFDCGFGDLSTFNARFRAAFGVTPSAYRRGGARSGAADWG